MSVVDRLLSPLVPLSFGAPGLRLRRRGFAPLPRLDGQHVVVTGANSGIGQAATAQLAALGARVTMVCRDAGRAATARAEILAAAPAASLTIERCDLSSLADIAALAARLRDQPIDTLIHNAGVLPSSRIDTGDGLELTWATHVVGPHLLTRLLQPQLARTRGRVILVSSGGMYLVPLVVPGTVPDPYDGVRAYAFTKRAQVALAALWTEHAPAGPCVVAMHPGWADTAAVQASLPRFRAITRPLLRDAAGGADTIAWLAATAPSALTAGAFYFDRAARATHVLPWQHDAAEARAALWAWCTARTDPWMPGSR
ncbi:MAG: SDR family NAD(P)-dependent oxidoreductase [Deltaproteobacteria bacterium]|nr:SDR family NAD(P)-dependent oxidoreductase [Deltaproteobacteria bacterium]